MLKRLVLTLVLATLVAAPAQAAALKKADKARVERLARSLGAGTSLLVTDPRGRTRASVRPSTRRTLGSVTKLFTSSAAVLALNGAPRTAVELHGTLQADGTLAGDIVLRGG